MNAPKLKLIKGELVQISTLDDKGIVLLTVQNSESEQDTVSTSINYWKKVGKFFTEGRIVAIEVEIRKAGVTEYEDSTGTVKQHTSDGMNLNSIRAYSSSAYAREILQSKQVGDLEIINQVEEERANAAATYLSGTFASFK